jgi:hypothetical protein
MVRGAGTQGPKELDAVHLRHPVAGQAHRDETGQLHAPALSAAAASAVAAPSKLARSLSCQ